jgi:transposase
MARYEMYDQDQKYFIPLDQETNFPPGCFQRFLNDFIEEHVNLEVFAAKRLNDLYGAPAKHAKMMLKIIFYAFSIGIYSMREIVRTYLSSHIDFIYLAGYCTADHSTFSRFINMYRNEIIAIFGKTLFIAHNMGYVSKELVAIDGSKIKANASKRFTGTAATFAKKKLRYEKMIRNLLERAQRVNEGEEKRSITKQEAKKEHENIERVKNGYENAIKRIDSFLEECKKEDEKKQVNLVDRDSNMMEKENKYFQGYNCQAATTEHGIIAANDVINISSDRTIAEAMVKKTSEELMKVGMTCAETKEIPYLMDKGYHNSKLIGKLMRDDFKVLIPSFKRESAEECKRIYSKHCTLRKEGEECILECPGGLVMRSKGAVKQREGIYTHRFFVNKKLCEGCRYRTKCADLVKKDKNFDVIKEVYDNLKELDELGKLMKEPANKDKYHKRLGIAEPVFGTIKSARSFDSFLVRGLAKVRQHWSMLCTSFNLRRLYSLS